MYVYVEVLIELDIFDPFKNIMSNDIMLIMGLFFFANFSQWRRIHLVVVRDQAMNPVNGDEFT